MTEPPFPLGRQDLPWAQARCEDDREPTPLPPGARVWFTFVRVEARRPVTYACHTRQQAQAAQLDLCEVPGPIRQLMTVATPEPTETLGVWKFPRSAEKRSAYGTSHIHRRRRKANG